MADEQPLLGLKSRPRFRPKYVQVLTQVCFKNSKLKPTPTKAYFAHGCMLITAAGPWQFSPDLPGLGLQAPGTKNPVPLALEPRQLAFISPCPCFP